MPSVTREGPEHRSQGKELQVPCSSCNRETAHDIVSSCEYATTYSEEGFSVTGWDDYQLVECRGCRTKTFRHCSRNTEDSDIDPYTGDEELSEKVVLYPFRIPGRRDLEDEYLLPTAVRLIHEETLLALRSGMPVLAGIGIRALVETMAKERGASGRDLVSTIDDLVSQGLVTRAGATILHSLRIMGNQAAHEVKPHSIQDLSTAMDVIEHTLTGIYILPERASRLPQRHTQGGPPTE